MRIHPSIHHHAFAIVPSHMTATVGISLIRSWLFAHELKSKSQGVGNNKTEVLGCFDIQRCAVPSHGTPTMHWSRIVHETAAAAVEVSREDVGRCLNVFPDLCAQCQ